MGFYHYFTHLHLFLMLSFKVREVEHNVNQEQNRLHKPQAACVQLTGC